jgi:hypothetical protein
MHCVLSAKVLKVTTGLGRVPKVRRIKQAFLFYYNNTLLGEHKRGRPLPMATPHKVIAAVSPASSSVRFSQKCSGTHQVFTCTFGEIRRTNLLSALSLKLCAVLPYSKTPG